jgi:hypothetical protein
MPLHDFSMEGLVIIMQQTLRGVVASSPYWIVHQRISQGAVY